MAGVDKGGNKVLLQISALRIACLLIAMRIQKWWVQQYFNEIYNKTPVMCRGADSAEWAIQPKEMSAQCMFGNYGLLLTGHLALKETVSHFQHRAGTREPLITLPDNTLLAWNILYSLINCVFYLLMTVIVCHKNTVYLPAQQKKRLETQNWGTH